MYGVIVVPMRATMISMPPNECGACGTASPRPTAPQCGCASTAEIGYAMKTRLITRNARSTILYDPKTISVHSSSAPIGMAAYRVMCRSSAAAPMPTNSENAVPRFATSSAATMNDVMRMPKCSRTSSDSPMPVTAPSRAHISCTTTSATRMMMITQSN